MLEEKAEARSYFEESSSSAPGDFEALGREQAITEVDREVDIKPPGKRAFVKRKAKRSVKPKDPGLEDDNGGAKLTEDKSRRRASEPAASEPWASPVPGHSALTAEAAQLPIKPQDESSSKEVAPLSDECSTEASPAGENLNENLLQLFQAEKVPKHSVLKTLLQRRADPNHRFISRFKLHNVEFAVGHRGDIHHSRYSKQAGVGGKVWSGDAPFAALPSDSVDMLTLLVESHSVSPDLGSTVGEKRGATMSAPEHLRFADFSSTDAAEALHISRSALESFTDNTALHYTPLHVAARAGNEKCCQLLLQAAADMNGRCQVKITECQGRILHGDWYFTPLDTAIEMSQIAVVKLLLAQKADLIRSKQEAPEHLTSSQDKFLRVDRYNYALQSLLSSGNSRVISEVAAALQDTPQQVACLTVEDIVRFLKTPGNAPVNLMKALFYQTSQIKYWKPAEQTTFRGAGKYDEYFRPEYIMNVKQSDTRVYAQSANIRKILVYGKVQHVINFTEGPSRDDVDKHWKDRRVLRDQIPQFVQRVAPQPQKASACSSFASLFRESVYLPVNFFACLVANLHQSEDVLLAIASCPNQEIFRLRECEAIVSFNWTTVRYIHLMDLAIQAATSLLLLFSISTLRDEAPEWCANLPWFALTGLPFVMVTVIMRFCEVLGNKMRELWEIYTEAVELILAIATMVLFIIFMIPPSSGVLTCADRGVVDHLSMRAAIIVVSSLRLMHNIDMLRLAFSEVNMIVTPIISALARSLPFCIAVIYFAFIMWQAYWTLDVEEWQNGWKAIIIAWRFAVLGDFEVDELEGQEGTWHEAAGGAMLTYEDPELTDNSTVVRGVFIVLCGMMFPVLIMNILISVLSVWLDFAIKNVWLDFQRARARRVLKYKALIRLTCRCHKRKDTSAPDAPQDAKANALYIWFSAPKEEEILENDVAPGLNLKFKEAAEGDQRIESRLIGLERSIQILVDSTTRNDRRRAKNTFEKAFSSPKELNNA
ncbi:unnamed protein product [Symbiodinium pilosum]|uniref:Uncharacterized protein n=1 Tax=Symbiodinium pilosum TaxID=2952 RepID=A0A812LSX3_SYMPI|nr:unnamed protein product [Symbiodinium pilosum]